VFVNAAARMPFKTAPPMFPVFVSGGLLVDGVLTHRSRRIRVFGKPLRCIMPRIVNWRNVRVEGSSLSQLWIIG
jgi:hypothetical protein